MNRLEEIYQLFLKSEGVNTDSRTVKKGELFFTLSGERFDGNIYAEEALRKGATAAVVDNKDAVKDRRFILVRNTLVTLQQLANLHLAKLEIPVLAITGTNGKTTTKELVAAVLSSHKNIHYTKGNLNNHIGVPLTLLSIPPKTELVVVEMGANHPGEIAALCNIAPPDYGIITNIGRAHLEGFGSFEGVLNTKKELYDAVAARKGLLFVNADDPLLLSLSNGIKRITYGKKDADVTATLTDTTPYIRLEWVHDGEKTVIPTRLYGTYNFYNVTAAVATGVYFHVPPEKIVKAVASYIPKNNRSQIVETDKNRLILDAYNANPVSMAMALQAFHDSDFQGKTVILGDMFELGTSALPEHKKVVELLKQLRFDHVILIGNHFCSAGKGTNYRCFKTTREACAVLKKTAPQNRTILIKGSRGMQLEQLTQCL